MKKAGLLRHAVVPLLLVGSLLTVGEGSGRGASSDPSGEVSVRAVVTEYARLRQELKGAETGLVAMREELPKLRHKWVVKKGRTPTEKEIKEFEEKLAKGKAKPEENPYYNQTPLTTPAPARAAYYAKLEEIRRSEERIARLKQELSDLDLKADRAGVPMELRR
ncbi:hypothetical protein LPW11_01765 [Geomonas sp. RF6]|uniref:hypothetical protein n=1 Tax=Geomonas sp. RF6 TaxID=2897342 RepID=UPI001E6039B7|nr:hypothetical protein [Geomonas sp. RF6]UFS70923.1 hypothetical protein LPW11_01765 [Geomonas sp. RF6]